MKKIAGWSHGLWTELRTWKFAGTIFCSATFSWRVVYVLLGHYLSRMLGLIGLSARPSAAGAFQRELIQHPQRLCHRARRRAASSLTQYNKDKSYTPWRPICLRACSFWFVFKDHHSPHESRNQAWFNQVKNPVQNRTCGSEERVAVVFRYWFKLNISEMSCKRVSRATCKLSKDSVCWRRVRRRHIDSSRVSVHNYSLILVICLFLHFKLNIPESANALETLLNRKHITD